MRGDKALETSACGPRGNSVIAGVVRGELV
jgi:hypothetical protein